MSFFHKRRFFILLIGIIILIALIGYSLSDRENLTTPEQFIKDTVGWAQNVFHTPDKFFTNIFGNIDDLQNTYQIKKYINNIIKIYKKNIKKYQKLKK